MGASPRPIRAVLHWDAGPALQASLRDASTGGLVVDWCPVAERAGLAATLHDADVLLHVLDPVTDELLGASGPRLRLVQKMGVGVNTIDLESCRRRGIAVCNMPGTNAPAVAEQALALVLAVLRRLPEHHEATRAGRGWALGPAVADSLGEVNGRRVGLVGYGAIGQRFGAVLEVLGADVRHWSRRDDRPGWMALDDLLAWADVVSLHVPLTDGTAGLLSRARLARMRPGAVLVNTARGGLVDQAALVEALASGHLRGAGLDVFAHEPVDPADPILSAPNTVLAPHVAWLTVETMQRCLAVAVENCRRLGRGDDLVHRVV